jgi:hypothetical protein
MKKLITIVLIVAASNLQADNPPETYGQFKHSVCNMKIKEHKSFDLNTNQKLAIGAGVGFVTMGMAEYFSHINLNQKAYYTTIIVGGLIHAGLQIYLILEN